MITRILICTIFTLFTLSGCGLIYKQNIQQGNAIEQDDLDELYEGMSKRQVLFVLGTPSIQDPFHQDRWDYVQTFSRRGSAMVQRTVTLHFEDDLLTEIIGGDKPFGADDDDTSSNSASAGIASFVKKPGATASDPNDAAVESAADDALAPEPAPDYSDELTPEDMQYQENMDVLDQTPNDGLPGPDIDG
jgi:outer membrane protein assembly factor BamE